MFINNNRVSRYGRLLNRGWVNRSWGLIRQLRSRSTLYEIVNFIGLLKINNIYIYIYSFKFAVYSFNFFLSNYIGFLAK